MSLQKKLVALLSSLVILPMVVSLVIGYVFLQDRLEGFIVERLAGATNQKVQTVESYFTKARTDIDSIVASPTISAAFRDISTLGYQENSAAYTAIVQRLDAELLLYRLRGGYEDLKVVLDDKRQQVAYVNNPAYRDELGQTESAVLDDVVTAGGAGLAFSDVFIIPDSAPEKFGMYMAKKIVDNDNLTLGIFVLMLDLTPVYDEVTSTLGLSTSGESFLLRDDGYSAVYLTPLKYDAKAALARRATYGENSTRIVERAARGQTGAGQGLDYRGKEVIAAWAPVKSVSWSIETKIDRDEALVIATQIRTLAIIATVLIFAAVSVIVWVTITRLVERPLRSLQRVAEELSNGHYDAKVDDSMLYQSDEFGKLATFIHHIAHRLKYEASGRQDQHRAANDHPSRDHHPQS